MSYRGVPIHDPDEIYEAFFPWRIIGAGFLPFHLLFSFNLSVCGHRLSLSTKRFLCYLAVNGNE